MSAKFVAAIKEEHDRLLRRIEELKAELDRLGDAARDEADVTRNDVEATRLSASSTLH